MKMYIITARVEVQAYDSVDALMQFAKQMEPNPMYSTMDLIDVDILEVK